MYFIGIWLTLPLTMGKCCNVRKKIPNPLLADETFGNSFKGQYCNPIANLIDYSEYLLFETSSKTLKNMILEP